MDEYIIELCDYCKNHNVDSTEYITKVKNYFELGKQIDLTDQQIIERLGPVENLVDLHKEQRELKIVEKETGNYGSTNLSIEMPFDVCVVIETSDNDNVSLDCDDQKLIQQINLSVSKDSIKLSPIGKRFSASGELTLYLPDISYKSVSISTVNGDIECENYGFVCDRFKLESVNSDGEFKFIKANDLTVDVVSADVNIENVDCQYCKLNSVSGDITIEKSIIDHLKVNTVSGDISVDGQVGYNSCDSLSGDIYINGEKKRKSFPFK